MVNKCTIKIWKKMESPLYIIYMNVYTFSLFLLYPYLLLENIAFRLISIFTKCYQHTFPHTLLQQRTQIFHCSSFAILHTSIINTTTNFTTTIPSSSFIKLHQHFHNFQPTTVQQIFFNDSHTTYDRLPCVTCALHRCRRRSVVLDHH